MIRELLRALAVYPGARVFTMCAWSVQTIFMV
jgi:hypothetical protein